MVTLSADSLEIKVIEFGGWDNFYKISSDDNSSEWMEFDIDILKDDNGKFTPKLYKETHTNSYFLTYYGITQELPNLLIQKIKNQQVVSSFSADPTSEGAKLAHSEIPINPFQENEFLSCYQDSTGFKISTINELHFSDKYLSISLEDKETFLKYHSVQPQMRNLLDSLEQEFQNKKPKTLYTLKKTYEYNDPVSCTFDLKSRDISYSEDSSLSGDYIYFSGDTLKVINSYLGSPGYEDEEEITTIYNFLYSEEHQELILDNASRLDQYEVIEKTEEFITLKPTRIKEYITRS